MRMNENGDNIAMRIVFVNYKEATITDTIKILKKKKSFCYFLNVFPWAWESSYVIKKCITFNGRIIIIAVGIKASPLRNNRKFT